MGEESSWRDRLLTYTQETSLHGISHVTAANRSVWHRVIWAVLFVLALSGFLYYLVTGVIRFRTYPVATNMEYQLQSQLQFPSVTLCNCNAMRKSYSESLNNDYLQLAINVFNPLATAKANLSDPQVIEEMSAVKMDDIGANSGHLREEMFMACNFMSKNFTDNPCQFHEDLLMSVSTQYGFCYTFNPQSYIEKHGEVMSDRAGKAGGLYFLIDIQQDEYIVGSRAAGMKVLVHDPKEEPLLHDLGYSIHPGTETNLVITKVQLDNLPPPYEGSSCVETNPERNSSFVNPLKHFKYYSHAACKMECKRQFFLKSCGCVGYFMGATPDEAVCDVYQFVACFFPSLLQYDSDSSIESACGCFRPCEETKYTVTQSSASFPADYMLPDLMTTMNKTEEFFRKNAIELNIYYGELGYTKIIQRSDYTSSSLFAEVGGLCGLFLGASLLTMAELADVCAAVLALVLKGSGRSKTKVQQINTPEEKPKMTY